MTELTIKQERAVKNVELLTSFIAAVQHVCGAKSGELVKAQIALAGLLRVAEVPSEWFDEHEPELSSAGTAAAEEFVKGLSETLIVRLIRNGAEPKEAARLVLGYGDGSEVKVTVEEKDGWEPEWEEEE